MKKGLLATIIAKRKVTIFMMIMILIFGVYSYYIIPKQEDPDITVSVAVLTTVYPGASSEDVEKLVTRKIEDALPEIENYDYSTSTSKNSVSIIVVRLVADADVDESWRQLREKMTDIQHDLPEGAQEIEVNTDLADTAGMLISLSGDNYSYSQLESYADKFKNTLMKIDGIAKFEITGKQEKEIKVEVDSKKLNFHNLSLDDIVQILKAQNIEIPSGSIESNNININVQTPGLYSSLAEIENTVIDVSKKTGAIVRLKDIASVYMGQKDSNYKIKHNGKNAILLTGYFEKNKNILLTGKEVEDKLATLKQSLPKDININEVLYQPNDVSNSIKDFMMNLFVGVLIVIAVVFLSMGMRNAIIVSTAIPLSLFTTFSMMKFLNIPVHQVSIAALIISLGMLVDNAIVISDAIQVKIDDGKDNLIASVEGAKEVAIPILTSTLTTVLAFVPLLLLPGMAGEFIQSLPQIIMVSLTASYLIAMFVSPTMAFMFFQKTKSSKEQYFLRGFFDRLLKKGLDKKKATIFLSLLLFVLALTISSKLGLQFFPKADKDMIYVDIVTERASDIAKTEEITKKVENLLSQQDEVVQYTTAIGGGLPKFYFSVPISSKSKDQAQILAKVDLKQSDKFKSNTEFTAYLQENINNQLVGGTAVVKELEQGEPIGAPVVIRVTGDDLDNIADAANKIKTILHKMDGTINVDDDISDKIYDYEVKVDFNKASALGLTKWDIQRELNIALKGKEATVYRNKGNEYGILVTSNIKNIEDLKNLAITSSITRNKILLKEVADLQLVAQMPTINKYDREISFTVLSDVKPGYSSIDIQNNVQKQLDEMKLKDVSVVFDGEQAKIKENFGGMGEASIFTVFIIFIVLFIQFNSVIQPIVILLTIPLSVIGSIAGLFLFRQPLSFTALLGMVSLMGIVVNNAIVLVDFINGERKKGMSIEEAAKEATNKRFRPVMLTTLTTVIGLFPLAFSGSHLFVPMSVSLISGLIVSTLLTLVIIPIVYTLVENKLEQRNLRKQSRALVTNSDSHHISN